MALELKVATFNPVPLDFNYAELKKEIEDKTLPYKGLIVTEDAIPAAKTDLANLRRLEKAIDDRRKAVKKEYNAPYMEFETKIKDILADVQAAEANIDGQVKAFEKKVEDEKLENIKAFYAISFAQFKDEVPFERIYNPKWLNKGYKMPDIEEEIAAAANKLWADIGVVKGLKTNHEASLLDTLYTTLDLGKVLEKHNILTTLEEKRKAEEQARKEEEERRYEEAVNAPITYMAEDELKVNTPEPLQEIAFRVWVTEAQKAMLKKFLVANGIRYGKA